MGRKFILVVMAERDRAKRAREAQEAAERAEEAKKLLQDPRNKLAMGAKRWKKLNLVVKAASGFGWLSCRPEKFAKAPADTNAKLFSAPAIQSSKINDVARTSDVSEA